jgi:hypothetical protein
MGACFDPTGTYRYSLWRSWAGGARLVFIMLNPSTADAHRNDPTIHRCIRLAQRWGYGSLEVVNLFAYRTPDPRNLKKIPDPIGPENDAYLCMAAARAERVLLAWGNWGSLHQRDCQVLNLLPPETDLCCLGVNRTGQPRHPLYVSCQSVPQPWSPPSSGWRLPRGYS